jgi:hypothetical protein
VTSARRQIRDLVLTGDPYRVPAAELRTLQLEAAGECFAAHREQVPLLRRRAQDTDTTRIRTAADLVPLLFSHTSYKSYALSWITGGRWDRMTQWYATVSSLEPKDVDVEGVADVDDWIARLAEAGHTAYITSGTSGKCSFLGTVAADQRFLHDITRHLTGWPDPLEPAATRRGYHLAPARGAMRSIDGFRMHAEAFVRPGETVSLTEEPLRVAEVMRAGILRRRLAEGTADPGELARHEQASRRREADLAAAVEHIVDELLEHRHEPLLICGMWLQQYAVAQAGRARGVADGEFHPDTLVVVGGGNKGLALPEDYQQQVFGFYGPVRRTRSYGMSEMLGSCHACEAGRYHVPPWIVPLILDEPGERLLNTESGIAEGRFAFLDVAIEGRWGGLITGDRVSADFSPCACGRPVPVILPDIRRYGELGGDDKINCAATLDSYVRGLIA